VALVPLLLAWVSYRSAVVAAIAYGEAVRVAFDLHHLDLYAALHLELPHDPQAEQKLGKRLSLNPPMQDLVSAERGQTGSARLG